MGGLRLLGEFYRKNKGCVVIAVLCIERGIFMWMHMSVDPMTLLTYSYIFLVSPLVPLLLTPQLFMRLSRVRARQISATRSDALALRAITTNGQE